MRPHLSSVALLNSCHLFCLAFCFLDCQPGPSPRRRCFFKLGDVGLLGSARTRLAAARAALARAHGANLERLRTLHGNFQPELATCAPAVNMRYFYLSFCYSDLWLITFLTPSFYGNVLMGLRSLVYPICQISCSTSLTSYVWNLYHTHL